MKLDKAYIKFKSTLKIRTLEEEANILIKEHGPALAILVAEKELQSMYDADEDIKLVECQEAIVKLCLDNFDRFLEGQEISNEKLKNNLDKKRHKIISMSGRKKKV
jgi:hypothetical protein